MKGQGVAAAGRFLYFSGSDTLPDAALSIWMSAHAWVCGTVMQSYNLDHGMAVAARTARPWVG